MAADRAGGQELGYELRPRPDWRFGSGGAVAAVVAGGFVLFVVARVLQTPSDLLWAGGTVLLLGALTTGYVWLHLRNARIIFTKSELRYVNTIGIARASIERQSVGEVVLLTKERNVGRPDRRLVIIDTTGRRRIQLYLDWWMAGDIQMLLDTMDLHPAARTDL